MVVAIIGVLATIAVPMYSDYLERIKVMEAIMDISSIGKRLTIYQLGLGAFPASLAEINADSILDPWGNPYQYLNLSDPKIKGAKGHARKDHSLVPINSDFDLYSMGKDGNSVPPLTGQASRDDIVRASNGRFIGKASDY